MPNFIFAYHGGKKPETPEKGAKHMEKWKAWVDSLGDAWVNPGTPLGKIRTVSTAGISDAPKANPLTGFSIVKADNLEAALEMARQSPHLEHWTIEVAELISMS